MKKTLKRILLGICILVVIIILFFVGYMLKAKSEIKKMSPVETKEIVDNIFSIRDSFSNLYLVKDSDQYIVFDAGNDPDIVSGELTKLGISPEKISAVFLTHSDGDHVRAIKLFGNAKIYLSVNEEQMINGETPRFLFFGNKIDTKEYLLIADRQVVNIGNIQIEGILTPGHTPGSMCYLVNDKYLFTGDLLSIKDGLIGKNSKIFNMDTKTSVKSIDNITHLPDCEYIFSAHYGFTNDYNNAIKDWIK